MKIGVCGLGYVGSLPGAWLGTLCRNAEILVLGQDATTGRHCDKHFRSGHIVVDRVHARQPGVLTGSFRGLRW